MTQYAKYLSSSVKLSSTNIITPVTMQRPDYFILNFKTFIKVATITFIFLCLKVLKSLERFFFGHCLVLINYMDIFWWKNSGWMHMTMSCLNYEKNSWQTMASLEWLQLLQQPLWIGAGAVLNWKTGAAKHGSFSPLLSASTLDSNWGYKCKHFCT